jgi:hypothetical protein
LYRFKWLGWGEIKFGDLIRINFTKIERLETQLEYEKAKLMQSGVQLNEI